MWTSLTGCLSEPTAHMAWVHMHMCYSPDKTH